MNRGQAPPVEGSAAAPASERGPASTRRRRQSSGPSRLIVAGLTVAAAVGGALAGCHPTGTPVVDPLYTGLFAAVVTVAASRAGRASLLVLAGVGLGLSRGWWLIPSAAALLVAFASVFPRRPRRRVGALTGALSVEALLHWPAVGFDGLTALLAAAVVLLCLLSAVTHISTRSRRWTLRLTLGGAALLVIGTATVAVGALLAHPSIRAGVDATEGALTTVSGGETQAGVQHLTSATTDFATASDRAGSWWSAGGLLVPLVAQQRRAITGAVGTGRDVTATAARVASTVDFDDLASSGGRFDLARIRRLGPPIDQLDGALATAQVRLARVRSPWLVAPIQTELHSLVAKLDKARSGADTAAMAVRAAPGLLGGDGTRHYLIAFMTPSESRGLDGFIGAYGELGVDNGRIRLIRAGSVTQLNDVPKGSRHITGPGDYLARYGEFHPADHFQDLSYSPDFPTVEQVIAQVYPQSGGDHIDGVLALDPVGLAALLSVTGPVTVPGMTKPLTSADAASFLLEGEYRLFGNANAARHDFLQEALAQAFHRLVAGRLPPPQTVARQLDPEVHQGRILFWTDVPSEQPLLRRVGLAGSFPLSPGRDVLSVTTQNAANNKIDAYLHRSIDDQVRYDPATGQTRATLRITLHNAAAAAGLPEVVLGSFPGSGLPPGTNRIWLSVYSPLQFTGGTEDGRTLGLSSTAELGVHAYSAYVDIGPGRTVTLEVHLSGRLRPGPTYSLTVRNQPMVNPDHLATSVSTPDDWIPVMPTALRWDPAGEQHQTEIVRFRRK